jgi:ABC-type transporter Mla MlaB component
MEYSDFAVTIRPGEHACCRFAQADDRERLAAAFVRDGLRRGHKVVYLCDRDEVHDLVARLTSSDDQVEPALARGQLDVRAGQDHYAPGGTFDADQALDRIRSEHSRALVQGYSGLSMTGEMGTALCGAGESGGLADFERRISGDDDVTRVVLCQYDHRRFPTGALTEAAAVHAVDAAPELAAIGRDGCLAAAVVRASGTIRLAGELDYGCAKALADVLDGHFHGPLRLDLADLSYIDVAGMRALRGHKRQHLTIAAASESVRRLLGLLAWDTEPGIEIVAT